MENSKESKLVDGRIPAYTECPFREKCEIAQANRCNHLGVFHKSEYSCATARGFDLLEAKWPGKLGDK